jgi:hypothetical protein
MDLRDHLQRTKRRFYIAHRRASID